MVEEISAQQQKNILYLLLSYFYCTLWKYSVFAFNNLIKGFLLPLLCNNQHISIEEKAQIP